MWPAVNGQMEQSERLCENAQEMRRDTKLYLWGALLAKQNDISD